MSILEIILDYSKSDRPYPDEGRITCLFLSFGAINYSDMLNPRWRGNDNERIFLCVRQPR